jgi:hypothetical protein
MNDFTPRQVQIFGVFVAITAVMAYLLAIVFALQGYLIQWYNLNGIQMQHCNQTTWNAISTSSWAFGHQYLNPSENLSSMIYGYCAGFSGSNTLPLP